MAFPHILSPRAAQVAHLSRQIESFDVLPPVQQRAIQAHALRSLLRWAATHSQFWRVRLPSLVEGDSFDPFTVLREIPPLSRIELQTQFDALSCAHAMPEGTRITLAHSNGTTGQPVAVQKELEAYRLRYLAYSLQTTNWHRLDVAQTLLKFGARVQDTMQAHWGAPDALFFETGPLYLRQSMDRDLAELYASLVEARPAYVVSGGSVIHAIARYALQQPEEGRPSIRAILSTGENATEALREDCLAAFGARVIDRYSNEEMGWLAVQCPNSNHLHVMSSNVYVEIVDDDGRPCPVGVPGRVLLTGLHSEAMPLIRYDVGDVAEWGEACGCCHLQLPVIGRLWGRQREFLRTPDGQMRHIIIFAERFLEIAPVLDMRFRYYSNPLLRFELVAQTPISLEQRSALEAVAREMVGHDCPVEIVELDRIQWGATDKRNPFLDMGVSWPVEHGER